MRRNRKSQFIGKDCLLCKCRVDGVQIDMRPFMEKFRPAEFPEWNEYWYGTRQSLKSMENLTSYSYCLNHHFAESKGKKSPSPKSPAELERDRLLSKAKKSVVNLWSSKPPNLFAEKVL